MESKHQKLKIKQKSIKMKRNAEKNNNARILLLLMLLRFGLMDSIVDVLSFGLLF